MPTYVVSAVREEEDEAKPFAYTVRLDSGELRTFDFARKRAARRHRRNRIMAYRLVGAEVIERVNVP